MSKICPAAAAFAMVFYAVGHADAQPSVAQPVVPGYQTAPSSNSGSPLFVPYGPLSPVIDPSAATPITASATGTTGATAATLAASATLKTWICGFSIRANATAAATGTATITGSVGGTMSFVQWTAPLASGIGVVEEQFNPCIPSSAVNTPIVVLSAAPGSGGTISVNAWGYQE